MKMQVLHVILLMVLFSKHSTQDCLSLQSVFVPEPFLLPDTPHHWFVPLKEKPNKEKGLQILSRKDPEFEDGGSKTICMSTQLDHSMLAGTFNLECSFEQLSQLTCDVQLGDDVSPFVYRPLLPKRILAQPVKTDERTYAAYVACIGNHLNLWFVIANVNTFPADTENEIKDFLYSIGLETDNEDGMDYSFSEINVVKGGC